MRRERSDGRETMTQTTAHKQPAPIATAPVRLALSALPLLPSLSPYSLSIHLSISTHPYHAYPSRGSSEAAAAEAVQHGVSELRADEKVWLWQRLHQVPHLCVW